MYRQFQSTKKIQLPPTTTVNSSATTTLQQRHDDDDVCLFIYLSLSRHGSCTYHTGKVIETGDDLHHQTPQQHWALKKRLSAIKFNKEKNHTLYVYTPNTYYYLQLKYFSTHSSLSLFSFAMYVLNYDCSCYSLGYRGYKTNRPRHSRQRQTKMRRIN